MFIETVYRTFGSIPASKLEFPFLYLNNPVILPPLIFYIDNFLEGFADFDK